MDNENAEGYNSDSSFPEINQESEDDDVEELGFADASEVDQSEALPAMEQNDLNDQQVFDIDLPCLHTYLANGQELEVVRGRTVFEDGAIVTLDLLQPADVVLMPGQTLPLAVFDAPTINMLRNCIRNDRTFGVLASWTDGRTTTTNDIGTTAEIYEYLPEEGAIGFRVKAKARQRFRLLESELNRWKAKVRILPEVQLPDPLDGVKLQSLYRHRTSIQGRRRCRKLDAAVTRWPAFVFEQYDVKRLIREIKHELANSLIGQKDKEKEKTAVKVVIPDDPSELSFWVAQNMPMKEEDRVMLLKLNSPIQRLRWQLKALQLCRQELCCQFCMNSVGSSADIFSMSMEGPQSTFVNPGGYLHETITLYKVRNIFSTGSPSTEYSWFPGYSWCICKCKHCNQHMGWKFMATKNSLKPAKFWGICRRSITVKLLPHQDNDTDSQLLVF